MPPLIQFRKVTKKYGKKLVLNVIDFDISPQDIFGIIGVSGSGKTTILNLMIGFLKADSGEILFQNKNILKDQQEIERLFGFVTQEGSFYDKLSIKENMAYFGKLYNLNKGMIGKKTDDLLKLVDLSDAKNVLAGELSTGMRRRLDIACSLIHNPSVLIMDEPTEDLDPALRREILALIRSINKSGTTVIITSHLLDEMETICTKIAVLHNNKIIITGSPNDIKKKYSDNNEIHLKTYPGDYNKIIRALNKRDISNMTNQDYKLVIRTTKSESVLKDVLSAIKNTKEELVNLSLHRPTLEEVFEAITKKKNV